VSDATEVSVPVKVRETVQAVETTLAEKAGKTVMAKEVEECLGLDKGTISKRIKKAIELGYLEDIGDGQGYSMKLKLKEPMPEDTHILPAPSELEGSA
jgi:hypothetical protein